MKLSNWQKQKVTCDKRHVNPCEISKAFCLASYLSVNALPDKRIYGDNQNIHLWECKDCEQGEKMVKEYEGVEK